MAIASVEGGESTERDLSAYPPDDEADAEASFASRVQGRRVAHSRSRTAE